MVWGLAMTDVPVGKQLWGELLRQIARRTRNPADAEDLLHAAYVRMEQYRAKHIVKNPAAFIVRAALNINIDNYRRDKLLIEHSDTVTIKDPKPLPDEVMASDARLMRAKLGLDQLPPRTREILLMHHLHRMKYHEIARQFGISESTVERHVARGLLFLSAWTKGW